MESFLFQKTTVRKIKNFFNNFLFFFVILSVVFYPLFFLMSCSIVAEGNSSSEISDSSDSEEAEDEDEEDDSGEEEEANEEETEDEDEADDEENEETTSGEEENIDNEEEGTDESNNNEAIEESSVEEQESEDAGAEPGSAQIDETTGTEIVEISENNDSDEDDFWKTCDLSDEEKEQIEGEEYKECREKTDCEKIEICIVEKIENINDTELVNNVSSEADTGNNVVSENTDESISSNGTGCEAPADCPEETAGDNPTETGTEESSIEESEETIQEQTVESEAVIDTGEAVATANVYNEANINIFSENYVSEILNISGEHIGDIDLLEKFQELLGNALANGETEENGTLVEVSNINESNLENTLSAFANTGNNSIEGMNGNIATGNANAASNLVNYVNLNITGNNWLFYAINIFGKWVGDLIAPGEGLLEVPEVSDSALSQVINENAADVENSVETLAATGDNIITGEGSVSTGEAFAVTNIKNIVNTNIVRNNWFFLMINNMGSWKGKVFGWDGGNSISNIFSYDFDVFDSDNSFLGSIFSVYNKNMARVSNSVSAFANTGDNSIKGEDSDISTGNASAWSNIFNLINTNITGNNWMFSIVNVMGEWEGDAVFAYPDLKISISDGMDDASPGEELSYSVEYENVGQAACEDTKVYLGLPEYFSYKSDNTGANYSSESGVMVWELSGLEPGEKGAFIVKGELSDEFPEGETTLMAGAGIATSTKEIESGNNSATDKTKVANYSVVNYVEYPKIDPEIKITREVSPGTTFRQGQTVVYSMIVENEGDSPVYNLIVEDELRNEIGSVGILQWPIGEIEEGESFLIQYQIAISSFAPLGTYTNWAVAYGNDLYGEEYESKKATSQIEVIMGLAYDIYNENIAIPAAQAEEKNTGQVLGAEVWKEDNDDRNLWLGFIFLILLFLLYELYIFRKNRKEKSATQPYS